MIEKLKILKISTNSNDQGLYFSFFFFSFPLRYVHDCYYLWFQHSREIVAAILAICWVAHVRHPWRLSFEGIVSSMSFCHFIEVARIRKSKDIGGGKNTREHPFRTHWRVRHIWENAHSWSRIPNPRTRWNKLACKASTLCRWSR